ncbi:MAG: VTT domain-containing protein [Clostridia bacterium]|nr:VTT domain-containing protein [Clostridia bacterium]
MEKSKKTKLKIISAVATVVIVLGLMVFLFSGDNFIILKDIFRSDSRDELRDLLSDLGYKGYLTIGFLSMLQVVMTFLPAEPVQVLAGVTFGFPIGLACCTAGVILGNTVIYILYKIYGDTMTELFDKKLHIDKEKISKSGRIAIIIFILYFLPAIPYGMICLLAATLQMKYPRYILVTTLGSIPSICIGVGLGHIAIASSWVVSVIVFAVLIAAIIVLWIKKDYLFEKLNEYADKQKEPYSSKTVVKSYHHFRLEIIYVISRIIFFFKGVKVKYTKKVADVECPAIVLVNHGSFIDFAYAGSLIRKKSPNFPVARLYFYKKLYGDFLRSFGCFPKSMFTVDLDSMKNSTKVIKDGGVLAMMPEARLSTAGEFEDIQEGTFPFLKKMGVPIYTVKICGDYFAKPKWGGKLRRGSLVEAELDILLTKEEVEALTVEEIKARVESALYYNEFEWIKTKPGLKYRSKNLAVGLENILTICPICKQKYTLSTKRHDIFCSKCGHVATLDDRYSFVGATPFENFGDWYRWQTELTREQILADPDFALTSPVTLKHSSLDGKTTLRTVGEGVCTLDRTGLTYRGTSDGECIEKHFPISELYRILFGAGENFEVYESREIYYFIPENPQSSVDWYICSKIIKDETPKVIL